MTGNGHKMASPLLETCPQSWLWVSNRFLSKVQHKKNGGIFPVSCQNEADISQVESSSCVGIN